MTFYLMASKPGAYTREGLIVGNPEAVVNEGVPTASFVAEITVAAAPQRLLSIVTDTSIEILQTSEGEDDTTVGLVPTCCPADGSNNTSYACLIHPATTRIWVREL
jgi:hypothetical protein